MPEPTLSELANIPSDAALGTAGLTDFVPVTRHVNQQIFEAAKFKANMDWNKYQSDLGNYKDLVKQGQDIADKDVAPQDRQYLQKQLADVFSEIEKNPKNNLGGTGLFNIQEKLSKVASEATQSKQDAAYDKWNRQHLAANPTMATDGNKQKIEGFLPSKPLGQRQLYILDPPDPVFDAGLLSGLVEKKTTDTYAKSYVSDATGKPGKGYLYDEAGTEFNPKAYVAQWDLALKDDPKIAKAIEFQYNKQPEAVKKQFPTKEEWYHQLGVEHALAIVPPGTEPELTEQGNVRYGKKTKISRDPSELDSKKLALNWYDAKTRRINATKSNGETIYNSSKGNALNGIPLTEVTKKDGEYDLTQYAGKQYLGQLQQVLGNKVLPDEILKSNDKEDAISIKVKGGAVQSINIGGKIYDRQEIENLQKSRDKERKGEPKMEYPLEQSYTQPQTQVKGEVGFGDKLDKVISQSTLKELNNLSDIYNYDEKSLNDYFKKTWVENSDFTEEQMLKEFKVFVKDNSKKK